MQTMSQIPLSYLIALVMILFSLGLVGVLSRRNVIVIFMCAEMMLNSVNLLFVAFSRYFGTLNGEVMVFFIMALAAAEAAVGLAIVITLHRNQKTVDMTQIKELRE
ncbi:MAG: NADH-quinone oxidoreductase subunit NuoK [Leptospiraceae bacterium]|nr:NADH-quinone oxidoreductase subunit NuoK [Leptospiraceae bacterium]MDW8305664.1 NADH-quinone oxidoreductase subunit NuoK [Leptospiraceae bacterium]